VAPVTVTGGFEGCMVTGDRVVSVGSNVGGVMMGLPVDASIGFPDIFEGCMVTGGRVGSVGFKLGGVMIGLPVDAPIGFPDIFGTFVVSVVMAP